MKLDFSNERVLAVVAHPDDAEMLCTGTLARAQRDGAAVGLCVMCRGDKGQPATPIPNLVAVRRKEMAAAAKLLGAQLLTAGFADGTLLDGMPARRKLIEVYRQFQPTLVLAHDPRDYHPDHRAASAIAEVATWFCASRGHTTRSPALERAPALWWMDTLNMTGFEPAFYVDVSPFMKLKEKMLLCHASQLQRGKESRFAPLIELMQRQCAARGAQAGVAAAEAFRAHHAFKRTRVW